MIVACIRYQVCCKKQGGRVLHSDQKRTDRKMYLLWHSGLFVCFVYLFVILCAFVCCQVSAQYFPWKSGSVFSCWSLCVVPVVVKQCVCPLYQIALLFLDVHRMCPFWLVLVVLFLRLPIFCSFMFTFMFSAFSFHSIYVVDVCLLCL